MSCWFLKLLGATLLSVMLLYSEVAWAVLQCPHDGLIAGYEETSSQRQSDASDPAFPAIHCLDAHSNIAPFATALTETRLSESTKSVRLKVFFESATTSAERLFLIKSFCERFLAVFFLDGSTQHLLLSVLRI